VHNVHLWLGDSREEKQSWVDWLISARDVNLIVGDFNIELEEIELPSHWSKEGPWDGCLFNTEVLVCTGEEVIPAYS
jgi:hypothetical protein